MERTGEYVDLVREGRERAYGRGNNTRLWAPKGLSRSFHLLYLMKSTASNMRFFS